MNTTKLMHVSPEMVDKDDMKNWNPEEWTRHLQEQVNHMSNREAVQCSPMLRFAMPSSKETGRLQSLQLWWFSSSVTITLTAFPRTPTHKGAGYQISKTHLY